jgi:hypothetical protein
VPGSVMELSGERPAVAEGRIGLGGLPGGGRVKVPGRPGMGRVRRQHDVRPSPHLYRQKNGLLDIVIYVIVTLYCSI